MCMHIYTLSALINLDHDALASFPIADPITVVRNLEKDLVI